MFIPCDCSHGHPGHYKAFGITLGGTAFDFGLWSEGFHGNVGIRKALTCCQQDARRRRRSSPSSPRYSYNTGSAGLVDGACYPVHIWVAGFGDESPDNFARDVLMGALSHL